MELAHPSNFQVFPATASLLSSLRLSELQGSTVAVVGSAVTVIMRMPTYLGISRREAKTLKDYEGMRTFVVPLPLHMPHIPQTMLS